jgi:HSP20 family molecular chaperone IbpA|tara:strand:+ start:1161 stop:1532 length:372 start_codon:yes stop_codon:yes gene_type:complete
MIYTIDNLLNDVFTPIKSNYPPSADYNRGNYSITTLEDGKQELILNVVGHNPKDVDVDVVDDTITITSITEKENEVVRNINSKFKVGKDFDVTTADASIENGVLKIVMDKKKEKKARKVNIKF